MAEDPFKNLEIQLKELDYPHVYMFKFICKSEDKLIAEVSALFEGSNEMVIRPSGKGNYTSISIKEMMMSAESILEIKRAAAKIKGVIIL